MGNGTGVLSFMQGLGVSLMFSAIVALFLTGL